MGRNTQSSTDDRNTLLGQKYLWVLSKAVLYSKEGSCRKYLWRPSRWRCSKRPDGRTQRGSWSQILAHKETRRWQELQRNWTHSMTGAQAPGTLVWPSHAVLFSAGFQRPWVVGSKAGQGAVTGHFLMTVITHRAPHPCLVRKKRVQGVKSL